MPRKNEDFIKAYMQYSKHSEAPDRCHFWTAVSVIAGALRRCVWLDLKYFHWTPNFYIVLVAPPGIISKSTTAKIGMDLLKQVPEISFGPNIITWQALVQHLGEAQCNIPIDGVYHPMSPLTLVSSEFGTFLNPQDREMVDTLVDLWDGQLGVFEKKTKTSGNDEIINPWLNIIACTTPNWIADNFPEYMIGGGFVSRTMFIYADKKRHLCAYPDQAVPDDFYIQRADLIHDLKDIAKNCKGEMTITPEARAWGEAWYADLWENRPAHLTSDRTASYVARRQTHMHKLAIILSVSRSNDRIITKDDLIAADLILQENEKFLPKVFEKIGDRDAQKAGAIVNFVKTNGPTEIGKTFSNLFHSMSYQQFTEGLTSAIRAGHVKQITKEGKVLLCPIYSQEEELREG